MRERDLYETPECKLMFFPADSSICSGSPNDKAGEKMEEGEYWYEY